MQIVKFLSFKIDVTKKATKNKTDRQLNETIKTTTYRKGDTITIEVPNVIYKDTVIEKINYENRTVARITYDKDGNKKFECMESQIKEITEINRQLIEAIKEKDKDKEEKFDTMSLLGVFAIIMFTAGFILFYYLKNMIEKIK